MASSVDLLASFRHLDENVPEWLTKLDALAARVKEQHGRFSRLTQFTEVKLTRKRHDSTESLRPAREDAAESKTEMAAIITEEPVSTNHSQTPHPPTHGNAVIVRESPKRKFTPSLANASGPQRYRTRSMVVVYYDQTIQDEFGQLVRNISGARNRLHKGKTNSSYKARMASLGMEENPFASGGEFSLLNPEMMRPRFPQSRPGSGPVPFVPNSASAFEQADKDLETAQGLCEVAAHQFLRDGDCMDEVEQTRKLFKHILEVAKQEVGKLEREEEQENQATRELPNSPSELAIGNEKVKTTSGIPMVNPITTIEVDNDTDASSLQIDLTAFRKTRRG